MWKEMKEEGDYKSIDGEKWLHNLMRERFFLYFFDVVLSHKKNTEEGIELYLTQLGVRIN